jgi:hypothetical protein
MLITMNLFIVDDFDRKMRAAPCLDSTICTVPRQLKGCALPTAGHYLSPSQTAGVAQW